MKTLKFIMVLAVLLSAGIFAMAQDNEDHSDYLESAVRFLEEGKCEKAEINYDVYKKMTGKTSSLVEKGIKDCKEAQTSISNQSVQMMIDDSPLYVDKKIKVYRNGVEIPESQLRLMFANTESYDLYDKALRNYKGGKNAMWTGLAFFTAGGLCQLGWLEYGCDWDTLGGGFSVAGFVLAGVGFWTAYGGLWAFLSAEASYAVDKYNKSKSKKVSFNYGFTGNGVYLGMTF